MSAAPSRPRASSRRQRLGLLALGIAVLGTTAPATAQTIPWIGLTARGAQLHEEVGQGHHGPGAGDLFGFAIAAGDFNGDGYDDLATGIPGNDCDFVVWDCGSVQVRFGWEAAALGGFVVLDPAAAGAPEPAHEHDEYGRALAVGDFNADGYDDLAVGIPGNFGISFQGQQGPVGGVQIHYGLHGSLGSIQWTAEHFIQQQHDGVPHLRGIGDRFGQALAVGDFNGDGHDDLAIGAPSDDTSRGTVIVGHGHIGGLVPFAGFLMELGRDGLPDTREVREYFGDALAAGDFDGDGYDDLAIGVPLEDDVGAVLVVYGSSSSLIFRRHWYFGLVDLGGLPQPGSRFGDTLATGDFNGDGYDDLAVGAPFYDGQGGSPQDIGLVSVIYGTADGLSTLQVHHLTEHVLYGAGSSEQGDYFGSALAAGDFDGDGIDDLAIGADGENLEDTGTANTGAVTVVPGRRYQGVTGAPRQLRPRGSTDFDPQGLIPDYRAGFPGYGAALAAGDFDGNGFDDLAIGAPRRDLVQQTSQEDTGAVAVLYGLFFRDGFESGNTAAWTSAAP